MDEFSKKTSSYARLPVPTADDTDRRLTGTVNVPGEFLKRIHGYLHQESKDMRMGIRKMIKEAAHVIPEPGLELPFSRGACVDIFLKQDDYRCL